MADTPDTRAELEALRRDFAQLHDNYQQLLAERDARTAEVATLRAALELLADPANWEIIPGPVARIRASDLAYEALQRALPPA